MSGVSISITSPRLKPTIATLKNIAKEIDKVRQKKMLESVQRIQEKMQEPGDAPTYPIKWDSPNQQRAFFATNGFGGGIPHKRTGKYQAGWRIQQIKNGVRLRNNSRAAPFVGGNALGLVKSRIHKGRWPLLRPAWDAEVKRLPGDIAKAEQAMISQKIRG